MNASSTVALLQPDASNHSTHGETKQVKLLGWAETIMNVLIELSRQRTQGDDTQTMGKMGNQQRPVETRIQALHQAMKQPRGIPKAMDQNERTGHPRLRGAPWR